MTGEITVKEALALPGAKIIDVRSEAEYAEATIPGALNIPLLLDAEREAVGTVYKRAGAEAAQQLGIKFVSPRLSEMVEKFRNLAGRGHLVVFCWRGGLRSKSVCSMLTEAGLPVYRLIGGYKAYRRHVNAYLDRPLPHKAAVIHGLTGVGKTEVLQHLMLMSAPAVDLEGLANNRGSVFGQISMAPQPSQKMFDGLLVKELAFWEQAGYIIVECESRRIGRIILPATLSHAMRSGIRILAYCPVDRRIDRIKGIYSNPSPGNKEELKKAIRSLGQRVGKTRVEQFRQMVDEERLDEVVEYLLINYYDPLYKYPDRYSREFDLSVDTSDTLEAARIIKDYLECRITET